MTRFLVRRWNNSTGVWDYLHDLPTGVDALFYADAHTDSGVYEVLEYQTIERRSKP